MYSLIASSSALRLTKAVLFGFLIPRLGLLDQVGLSAHFGARGLAFARGEFFGLGEDGGTACMLICLPFSSLNEIEKLDLDFSILLQELLGAD